MLRRIYEPTAEILFLAAGITLAVAFVFLFSFFPQRAPLGITALQA
jgi:hypothetical protein